MVLGGPCDQPHVHPPGVGIAFKVEPGDWILPDPDGIHFTTCKPDVFEEIYQLVECRECEGTGIALGKTPCYSCNQGREVV